MSPVAYTADASLYHPDFGNEPVGGKVMVSGSQLQFKSDAMSIDIPVSSLDVDFENAGDGFFLSDENQPEIKIFARDQCILRHPAIKSLPQVASILGRRELGRAVRMTVYFLAGCAVVTWFASMAMGVMARAIAARVPMEWERKTGAHEIEKLQKKGYFLNDSNSVAQLTTLAEPLIQVLPADRRDLKFYIANDPQPNAFALPGGSVVVNSGLLQLTDKPEELLGVLAHELAHQTKRHAIRKRISAAGPLVIFGVFLRSDSGAGNVLALGSGMMIYQGFSQEYETEADDTGWDYLVAANINPRGLIEAFEKLEKWEQTTGMHDFGPQAFQSHPATQKRIERLEQKWSKLGRKSDFRELPPVKWSLSNGQPP